jgi:hypothetical protein
MSEFAKKWVWRPGEGGAGPHRTEKKAHGISFCGLIRLQLSSSSVSDRPRPTAVRTMHSCVHIIYKLYRFWKESTNTNFAIFRGFSLDFYTWKPESESVRKANRESRRESGKRE